MTIIIPPARALSQTLLARSPLVIARASLSSNPLLRVTYNRPTAVQSTTPPVNFNLDFSLPQRSRTYATTAPAKPVGRPKAHTGRTTQKRSPSSRKSTTPTKVPGGPKKKATRSTSKKATAKPRTKKPLSKTAQKRQEAQKGRELKDRALLKAPKRLPATAWAVLFTENATKGSPVSGDSAKSAAQKYRNLDAEERERLNHAANQNRTKNVNDYKRWLSTFTPKQIKEANNARSQLRQQAKKDGKKKTYPRIQDDRQVKQPRNAYSYFLSSRVASGDMQNMRINEIGGLVAREWKALTAAEKKEFEDQAAKDKNRYIQEYKSVYGEDAPIARK